MVAIFIDTETTGIKRWDNPTFIPQCVQVGAILQDLSTMRVLGELNAIIDLEGSEVPIEAAEVHGITTELSQAFGLPKDVVDVLLAHMIAKADCVIAHNIQFDLGILQDNLYKSYQMIGKRGTFCTMVGSIYLVKAPLTNAQQRFFLKNPYKQEAAFKVPTLTEAHQYFFDRPFIGAHDAMADIRACRDIYIAGLKKGHWIYHDGTNKHIYSNEIETAIKEFKHARNSN